MESLADGWARAQREGPAAVKAFFADLAEGFSPDIQREAEAKRVAKGQVGRFRRYVETLNEAVSANLNMLGGVSFEDDVNEYLRLRRHAMGLWSDARTLMEIGRYASAGFLAIACIEETSKVVVAFYVLLIRQSRREEAADGGQQPDFGERVSRRKNPLFSHRTKHLLAAFSGALINSRVDRKLGMDRVISFLDQVEAKGVEAVRQDCLYASPGEKGLVFPMDVVGVDEGAFYVALAGELLAESAPDPDDWSAWTAILDRFEKSYLD